MFWALSYSMFMQSEKKGVVESHYMRSPSKMGLASSDLHQLTPSLPGYSNLSMLSGFISTL